MTEKRPVAVRIWSMNAQKKYDVDMIAGDGVVVGSPIVAESHAAAREEAELLAVMYIVPVFVVCRTSKNCWYVTDVTFPASKKK